MYEKLYGKYLELEDTTPNEKGFINLKCPFPDNHTNGDKHPSAGICIESGVFVCYGCGNLSPQRFLEKYLQINYSEAKEIISEFLNEIDYKPPEITLVKSRPPVRPDWNKRIIESQGLLSPNESIVHEYLCSRGLRYETLQRKGIGFLPGYKTFAGWDVNSLIFPYIYGGNAIAIRYRDILSRKASETGSNFHLFGADELEDQELAIITEGESDCLKTFEAIDYKYPVVSVPTCAFRKEWAREFQDIEQVILIPQADAASNKLIAQAQEYLGEKLTILELPWERREIGKDICDWVDNRSNSELNSLVKAKLKPIHKKVMTGYDLQEVAATEQPWIISNFIAKKQSGMIGGQAKSYKTWVMLNIIRCILKPGSFLFEIPQMVSVNKKHFSGNVGIIEEEGTLQELNIRASMVLGDIPKWQERTRFLHQLGVKLDSPQWEQKLIKIIRENNIGLLFIDPFQRMYVGDENDSNTIGQVWRTVANLLSTFDELAIILIHHFNKAGDIGGGFGSLRGSSRIAGELDVGMFVDKRANSENVGIKAKFDGRSIPHITTADNKDIFKLAFLDGILKLDSAAVYVDKHEALAKEVDERGKWEIKAAAVHYGTTPQTIKNWATKAGLMIIRGGNGNAAALKPKLL